MESKVGNIFSLFFSSFGVPDQMSNPWKNNVFLSTLHEQTQNRDANAITAVENLIQNLTDLLKLLTEESETKITACDPDVIQPSNPNMDPKLVQITAGNSEIERRIAAFIERKQIEVNERNNRQFCNAFSPESDESCARTDAVYMVESGFRSHVKVNRVVNPYGPQTRPHLMTQDSKPVKVESLKKEIKMEPHGRALFDGEEAVLSKQGLLTGVEERLVNMEQHVKISKFGNGKKKNVFERLRALEERILQLESISPEYFDSIPPPKKKRKSEGTGIRNKEEPKQDDLDTKLQELKRRLLHKQVKKEDPG